MSDSPEALSNQPLNTGFDSLKNVPFAGEEPAETTDNPEAEAYPEELTLEEKVARLRAPYEEDEPIRVAHTEERRQLQAEIDSRAEEIAFLSLELSDLEWGEEETERSRELSARKEELQKERVGFESRLRQSEQHPDYSEEIEPLTVADKERLLTPDALSELSLEEYIALWRRLNPFYASHVTRQGVRDHRDISNHTVGLGRFHSGFTDMLKESKSLHSAAELRHGLPEGFTREDVGRAMEATVRDNAKEIDERLAAGEDPEAIAESLVRYHDMCFSTASAEPWGDYHSIHFARNTCSNEIYGAETGNEVFYVYPIDVIASQTRFFDESGDGGLATATVVEGRERNNFFIWTESGRIPLDSGIVFLPKSSLVSPETGSIYETVESVGPDGETVREPILDEAVVQAVTKAFETLASEGFYDNDSYYSQIIGNRDKRNEFIARLETEFGIDAETAEAIISKGILSFGPDKCIEDSGFIQSAEQDGFDLPSLDREEQARLAIRYILEREQVGYKKAENPITSEEYWRRYFEAHPDEMPKHIVFYDGDPSEAVDRFLEENGIAVPKHEGKKSDKEPNATGPGDTHETDGPWLGFESHHVVNPAKDEKLHGEKARFVATALPIATELVRARQQELQKQ